MPIFLRESKDLNTFRPPLQPRVKLDLVRERVCLARRYWRYMFLVFVYNTNNLRRGLE